MEIFAFCVIIHEPIEIQTCSAPQNDRLNFVLMKKWLETVVKLQFSCRKFWGPPFTITMSWSVTALMELRRAAFKELISCTQGPLALQK